ncbi:serine hydrolase FSH [Truncatella angustata]|uniref:Serine hydrolase FSH n=1 Tax=Truncatella angustata TaxID=152316 RepID=A0A9P8UA93_9PEZI|nr:serine hydrolase FSH [Truncatella angustata]KAH6647104.1 serine hydrolase FSH [Truncatella angustata]
MSAPTQNGSAKGTPKPNGKTELKILMLHGYTQSGPLFKSKTGALNKLLTKALAPLNLEPKLIYPTGPHRLKPSDIPGFQPPEGKTAEDVDEEQTDSWAWFRRDEATGSYRGLGEGMRSVARAVRDCGGVDGVLGFSQGGAMAAMVAGALEPGRAAPEGDGEDASWVRELREANAGGLRFAVVYSGFVARDEGLRWLYEGAIQTPSLHFVGALDTVVEEGRSRALIESCREDRTRTFVHPGGHYVPVSKEWTMALVGWLREVLEKEKETGEKL